MAVMVPEARDLPGDRRIDGAQDATPPPRLRSRWSRPMLATVALAAVVATWAAVASLLVMPHLSVNRDEPVYLLQADALRDGRLFPPAPEPAEAFTPWFGVASAGRYVLKYTPVHAGSLALGRLLLGTERATIAIAAGAAVVLLYLLGVEVLRSRREAALAALLLGLSPLFLIQSMTFLSYVGNLVLLLGFAVALLRAERTGGRTLLVVSGAALGLAFFARPFDAVLFSLPFGIRFLARYRRAPARLLGRAVWLVVGVAPILGATLLFNRAATGNPLEFPFSILEPLDTIGFGPRRLVETDPILQYTPRVALETFLQYASLLGRWGAGGALLVGLALIGLWRSSADVVTVAAIGVLLPVGYLFFWGPANVSWMTAYLGPFYYLPLLVPLALLGARGLRRVGRWSRPVALATLVAVVATAGVVTERAVRINLRQTHAIQAIQQPFEDAELTDALVFLPGTVLLNPFGFARNDPDFDGPVVWALDRQADNLDVSARFGNRTPYALRVPATYGGLSDSPDQQQLELVELGVRRAAAVRWNLRAENRSPLPRVAIEVTYDGSGQGAQVLPVDGRSTLGRRHEGSLAFGARGVTFTPVGRTPVVQRTVTPPPASGVLALTVTASDASRSSVRVLGRLSAPYRLVDGAVEVLAPVAATGIFSAPAAADRTS